MSNADHIHILMCTYNGAAFLQEQLDSFLAQAHDDWSLWVQDDGSTDDTLAILEAFKTSHPAREIHVKQAKGLGVAMNFLSLMCDPELSARAGNVMLSDQDDVWLPHKLERALAMAGQYAPTEPVLYGSRTLLVDENLGSERPSRIYHRTPDFANALVQNILAGNTMFLNRPALNILRKAGPQPDVPFHDWWIYLLLSGVDAHIFADQKPSLLYRQHGSNTLGANIGRGALQRRLSLLKNRKFRTWMDGNIAALVRNRAMLTHDSQHKLNAVANRHNTNRLKTIAKLSHLGIRRQSTRQTIVLYLAYLIGNF